MKPEAYRNMTFEEIKGHLVEDRLATYQSLQVWGPVTTRRLAEFMRRDILTVRPRVTELCQMGLARISEKAGTGREGLYVAVPLVAAVRRTLHAVLGRRWTMACKFGFPMVASERLDNCADMAMDWLTKDQAFQEPHGGRNESDYWRNQWQLHKAMLARIEGRKGHLFMPNAPSTFPPLPALATRRAK